MSNFFNTIKNKFSKKEEQLVDNLISLDEYEELVESQLVTEKFKKGLKKSRDSFSNALNNLISSYREINEEFFEDLEELLIQSDVAYSTVLELVDYLKIESQRQNLKEPAQLQDMIVSKLVDIYMEGTSKVELNVNNDGLTVYLFVGVNGVGKTTSIGKLAYNLKKERKKVLIAAGDTFRAGAIDQLVVWADRSGADIIKSHEGSDPASVIFDAIQSAKSKNYDVLLCDTAGRLQNKEHLMKELEKIVRIIKREVPQAPHEVLLTIDATTGQNGILQAKIFKEVSDVTGVVLTKLDGTARGGIVIAIKKELDIAVKLVGLGENIEDLEVFDPESYIYSLFYKEGREQRQENS
ncbi:MULTISPECIES: signal recognition particle-docking protein FtsY [unclassified Gemella]|uniref:signal recognition particle-docking protein FtsY n=1 Tax=unclassified Gemella TaxID=2624949 RepID=UPI0010730733|nr:MULTISPECIES: signal recognition particle-docking protein FtsY [unclassified Gemella]MBF0710110.1 signal recognition particle-docking protein FtsY [Gemella sp. GL1.1]MBF0746189.1 signal recognition particle-docking protein FtsY [Gemella sp. 19428wG2_WT2a]NYS27454.1 signal recognition particle-docking protein FtsY [Gemella sp. GL1]TFU60474.1 signal recognition particle-docking protein FtsY [Gemella sp. WT2a]